MAVRVLVCLLLFGLGLPVLAQPPAKEEKLPAPRPLGFELVPLRVNRYDVWRYYGVDRYGQFRPLVIRAPYHSYYLQTGAPYPWVNTHPLDFMPHVVD